METKAFCLWLVFVLSITFSIHALAVILSNTYLWDHLIIESYLFNGLLTAIIHSFLVYIIKKKSVFVGWFFMTGSVFKLIFFFSFFYPFFIEDEIIEKKEIFSFFIPYLVSMIFETYSFVKMLKKI
jgi:hypothetical protein